MKTTKNINGKVLPNIMSTIALDNNSNLSFNYFDNTRRFINLVLKDEETLKTFIEISYNDQQDTVKNCEELSKELSLDMSRMDQIITNLKETDLIIPNPNPKSDRYRVSFNGKLFLKQLKTMFPNSF